MSITVFGSTDLTLTTLDFLYNYGYKIEAIVTSLETFKISYQAEGVKNSRFVDLNPWASEKNIPLICYENSENTINKLNTLNLKKSFALVVGWYHMVPNKLRSIFQKGCGGFHASLLPNLRGGAPLNWAILLDFKETGVSFFSLSDGVDDGYLYDQESFMITKDDYIEDLVKKSEKAILSILGRSLQKVLLSDFAGVTQKGEPSYCGQRKPEDSKINWELSCEEVLKIVRASSRPYFGAYTFFENEKIIIWKGKKPQVKIFGVPGQIFSIDKKYYVCCKDGALEIEEWSMNAQKERKLNQMRFLK